MTRHLRSRRIAYLAIATALTLGLAACSTTTPNTTLTPHSEFGRIIDWIWNETLILGTIVFVGVEIGLIVTIVKWRHRAGSPPPVQSHGNTTLEITWTLIPAVVLAFIAVPTIKAIFQTQAKAAPGSLQVEVIGHQWWWEFRYPQYNIVTANELYLPVNKTVSFALKTQDVLHSFWIPELAGKRDLISNRTNYLWFTPESTYAWNGFCAEFCGTSHANMHFRVFTVTQAEFDVWRAHQQTGPAYAPAAPPAPGAPVGGPTTPVSTAVTSTAASTPAANAAGPVTAIPVANLQTGTYDKTKLPLHVMPATPVPDGLTFDESVIGDAARGATLYKTGACIACHMVQGISPGNIGPNLTHVGSRTTLAAGIYPNDVKHMQLWIKNAPKMKPGVTMPVFGQGQIDLLTGKPLAAGYSDQQIADIVAYLQSLK
ncbi:MAG: cytochrome c oxidase subunit II [Gemmatimonadota bacterium]|nr:cytochrome c oxidase subunit II [Gemmatimonadota bacterium]